MAQPFKLCLAAISRGSNPWPAAPRDLLFPPPHNSNSSHIYHLPSPIHHTHHPSSSFPHTQHDTNPSLILPPILAAPTYPLKPQLVPLNRAISLAYKFPFIINSNHFFILLLSQVNLSPKSSQTPTHPHTLVQPVPRPKPAKITRKPPGLGTFGSAHGHLDLPLRSPTNPISHRAVARASVPTRFPETAAAAPLSGHSTHSSKPSLATPLPLPRLLSSCIEARNDVKDPPKLELGQGTFGHSPVGGGRIIRDLFGVSVGLSVFPRSILGIVCDYASF
ncbi:hypothetical protein CRG98_033316 [Punica granatum]|uniref:Uncharacterized protein n=1 Tax=Punica granatum TaxID=22663 RepID=A0A2I0IRI7_PUNGR|nr:hypothetical protein CRG98_033316 [Punica granatum]